MWNKPYSFLEGSAIVAGLIVVGLMLQLSMGPLDWDIFLWPANVIVLAVFVIFLCLTYRLGKHFYFFRFITSAAAAVPAIVGVCLLTLIMGLTKQVNATHPPYDILGISKMLGFWPFILVYVWMTAIVGQVAIKQIAHFSIHSLPSLFSHIGLFIVLTCGTLGSADMQRLKMYCELGKPEWRGLDAYNVVHELPIAIQLDKFTIEEYPPKLMVVDSQGRPLPLKEPQTLTIDPDFKRGELQGWEITVLESVDNAVPVPLSAQNDSLHLGNDKAGYVASDMPGSVCALKVEAKRKHGSSLTTRRSWVTCGSYRYPWSGLYLDEGMAVVMGQPEPKRFSSRVSIYTQDGRNMQADIEVNHPCNVDGWKVYQYSYNEQMGKWSNLSVFDLVRDPWLPIVYLGIILLAAGAIGMLFGNYSSPKSNLKPKSI